MSKIISALYTPEIDCIEVTLDNQFHVTFNCQNCNAQVKLTDPLDISYLTHLAREEPRSYASLVSRKGGLQGYGEALGGVELGMPFFQKTFIDKPIFINVACATNIHLHHFHFFHMHYRYIFEDSPKKFPHQLTQYMNQ